ncbi:MAG: hypothetical protein F4Y24_09595 [Gemmatimonadetes bacterium]|nr:hypothetical protein [Gemmatimonadota bacterium]MYG23689.1 hypothetical protein [Gemmatimonadota bacterium]MYJ39506.1 hypothetical protein [Gemmatimonadota bacterium]
MNRIADERVKFFFQHEARIREWVNLETEVSEFVDRFYRSLKGDLDAALRSGKIADDDIESFFVGENWPGLSLRRRAWPQGDDAVYVEMEWNRKRGFRPTGNLACGVVTSVERYKPFFTKEARPDYPLSSPGWPAWRHLDPPADGFWEGDNLKEYRNYLVETILKAWRDLAPLVDKAVGHRSG